MPADKTTPAPYGSWPSPITSQALAASVTTLSSPIVADGDVFWTEGRPTESGRSVLVRRAADGTTADLTPSPFNARTRAHEYGGGAATVAPERTAYVSNFTDQRIYRIRPGGEPEPLTHRNAARYADSVVDAHHHRLICVREDHTTAGEPENTIVAVDLISGDETVLVSGHDFFAAPRLSPDGTTLAWLAWDHPNMPWDGCTLYTAEVGTDGTVNDAGAVAGGPDESIFQPTWSPQGVLYFASDRSGFWNIYRRGGAGVECVHAADVDFGRPAWQFGMSTYAFLDPTTIAATYVSDGTWRLATIDTGDGTRHDLDVPYTSFGFVTAGLGRILAVAAAPTRMPELVAIDPGTRAVEVLRRSLDLGLDEDFLSVPEHVEFPTGGGLTAHGFFYPPRNRDHVGLAGELPPLVVFSHGGPTSATEGVLNPGIQFWTSRGFAVADVNYGGSSGYGRAYRRRLHGNWGIVDVDDCVNAARHLADQGLVDAGRMAIRGGSAGGYTTLAALAFRDVFRAGASHFGVGDLAALATDTHKFESRYLDSLIGPYPQQADRYRERSPLAHADQISCPVIFFQGLDDRIVLPAQAESMVAALKSSGVPVAYLPFDGEGHGFRDAAAIRRATEAELSFYGQVFGFTPAGDIAPVHIDGL